MRQCSELYIADSVRCTYMSMISHVDTSEVEKRLREKCDSIVLKQNVSGKSDVWKNFSLIFEKQRRREDSDDLTSVETLVELKYLCACNRCHRVRRRTAVALRQNNLIDHGRYCKGVHSGGGQLKLVQCMQQKPVVTNKDLADVKRKEVAYCI